MQECSVGEVRKVHKVRKPAASRNQDLGPSLAPSLWLRGPDRCVGLA